MNNKLTLTIKITILSLKIILNEKNDYLLKEWSLLYLKLRSANEEEGFFERERRSTSPIKYMYIHSMILMGVSLYVVVKSSSVPSLILFLLSIYSIFATWCLFINFINYHILWRLSKKQKASNSIIDV